MQDYPIHSTMHYSKRTYFHCLFLLTLCLQLKLVSMAEIVLPPPTDLTVGPLLTNPLGYGERDPQFSWKLPATDHGLTQSAFQIICASNKSLLATNPDLWDSGWVDSSQSVFIDYTGKNSNPESNCIGRFVTKI